jgi:uncharacterized protein YndB with AHSA1/START domain
MRFVRNAAITLGILFGLFILIGLVLPGEIQVVRSIEIDAPREKVFPLVDDLRELNRWSPWATMDSAARYEFSGPQSGVGARMSWSSENPDVGKGSQEIIRSHPPEQLVLRIDLGPQGQADAQFNLEPVDGGTHVSWAFRYEIGYDLIGRYAGYIMSKLVGEKYDEGLARLKKLAETGSV